MSEIFVYLYNTLIDKKQIIKYLNNPNLFMEVDEQLAREYCYKLQMNYLTIFDELYYSIFQNYEDSPLIIYYLGDINLLVEENIMFVSDNMPSKYAQNIVSDCIRISLNKNILLASEYKDINKQVIISSVVCKKNIILFCNDDFSKILFSYEKYIDHILENGLIFSFSIKKSKTDDALFKMLHVCSKLVIIESSKKSRINKLASYCASRNIEVCVAPGRIYDFKMTGNNLLIADGAELLSFDEL